MTTPTRFQRLEALFHAVVDLDEADRAPILETVRRREPGLYDELVQLLAREREHDGDELPGLAGVDAGPGVGDRVGPFRLERLLGEGGMGRVYEAEQTDPVRRRVALKLIQPHLWGAMARARFARERQALAALSHPGIAQVLEAGSTPEGYPWVALELVDGRPVTELCDDRRLSVAARLELMIEVLRAVQHAHLRGILHRDLKPSNLLVIEREGALRPKIIDFGLAKAVSEEGSDATLRTRLGEVIGTPEYMSPEQTLGVAVDARTDVYSLGVVLHELLTGVRPHEAASAAPTAADELRRRVREEDPPRPSSRIGSGAGVGEAARRRNTEPAALRRALAGDLDWILLRALAKNPEQRYESAAAFAADLEAHRDDRPVAAGPPSRAYRAKKFLRRHRLAAAATSIVAAALVAATVVSSILFLDAEAARLRAETERRKAEAVNAFLRETLARADPVEAQSRENLPVRLLLDEAAWRIPSELRGQPGVAAALHLTTGVAYRNLGLFGRAEEQLRRAVARNDEAGDLVGGLEARLSLAETLLDRGETGEAWSLALDSLERSAKTGGDSARWSARSRRVSARVEKERGELEAAETSLRRGLIEARASGDAGVEAGLQRDLGLLLADRGRLDEAVLELEAVVARRREALGDDHSEVAAALNDLAWVLTGTKQPERALDLQRQALATLERVYPEDHPQVAIARSGLAGALREVGRFAEAATENERVLASFRATLGDDHIYVAHELNNLATSLERGGEVERAVELYRESVRRYVRLLGADHGTVAIARSNLARALRESGDRAAAERECLESLRIRRASLRADHPDLARNLHLLARLRLDAGDRQAAVALLEEALEIRRKSLPSIHALTAATLYLLGVTEGELGRIDSARSHLGASAAIYEELARSLPQVHLSSLERARAAVAALSEGSSRPR